MFFGKFSLTDVEIRILSFELPAVQSKHVLYDLFLKLRGLSRIYTSLKVEQYAYVVLLASKGDLLISPQTI